MASEIEEAAGEAFRQFDAVTDYSDHHFAADMMKNIQYSTADCFTNARSSVYKKIMQEWKILNESLPDTIYVRAYEARIDLLRAVIIGAKGTPYHDGLFFFDIAFPKDYPNSPPKVHYRSFGLRVHPSLYASGFVCISILNTWWLGKCAKWNPECSSVLQILVSIQALVLNAKPYYNQPGPNEKVFIRTCKTILFTLRAPPRSFEEFVTAHFQKLGCCILSAIDAYRTGGALVGHYNQAAGKQHLKVSESFARNLEDVYKKLYAEFSRIKAPGVDNLRPLINEHESNKAAVPKKTQRNPKSKGDKMTIFGYLRRKVRKVFKIGHTKSSSSKML